MGTLRSFPAPFTMLTHVNPMERDSELGLPTQPDTCACHPPAYLPLQQPGSRNIHLISQPGALPRTCICHSLFICDFPDLLFNPPKTNSFISDTQNASSESSLEQQTWNNILQPLAQRELYAYFSPTLAAICLI